MVRLIRRWEVLMLRGALSSTSDWADKHGHVLLMGDRWELASGHGYGLGVTGVDEPEVRVLVKEGTTKAEALALLAKIIVWIEKDGMPN